MSLPYSLAVTLTPSRFTQGLPRLWPHLSHLRLPALPSSFSSAHHLSSALHSLPHLHSLDLSDPTGALHQILIPSDPLTQAPLGTEFLRLESLKISFSGAGLPPLWDYLSRLTELHYHITPNPLGGVIPSADIPFEKLTRLKVLRIILNPSSKTSFCSLSLLTRLESLSLSLCYQPLVGLSSLTRLSHLELLHTSLFSSSFLASLPLTSLVLQDTRTKDTKLMAHLRTLLPKLHKFHYQSKTDPFPICFKHLPLPNLTDLSLRCSFSDQVLESIHKLQGLRHLDISALPPLVSSLTNLRSLNLSGLKIADMNFLTCFRSLQVLDLSESSVGSVPYLETIQQFCPPPLYNLSSVSHYCTLIKDLRISNFFIDYGAVGRCMTHITKLEMEDWLLSTSIDIETDGMFQMMAPNLRELRITGVDLFSACLGDFFTLRNLTSLSWGVTEVMTQPIMDSLVSSFRKLRILGILFDKPVEEKILFTLVKLKYLKSLDIYYNPKKDPHTLIQYFKSKAKLTHLRVNLMCIPL